MTLATRIGIMNRGRIVQVGAPREIYEAPRTRFTAEFIGSVNLFEGRIVEGDAALASQHGVGGDHALIQSAELGAPLLADRAVGAARGSIAWAAVRPESMTLSRETRETLRAHDRQDAGGSQDARGSQGARAMDEMPGAHEKRDLHAEVRVNFARGVIRETAYRGGLSVYLLELESGKTVRITQPNGPRGPGGARGSEDSFAAGDRVFVTWHASSVVVVTE
jgi:putrescine transport system ATP-binding protein